MNKRSWPILASAAVILVLARPLQPQIQPFENFGLKDGVPQSQITSLAQDREGYLWVGTWGGLARFNGSKFRAYYVESGLPSNRIQELLAARDGKLWVATAAGLARWQDHCLSRVTDPVVEKIYCRALAEDGRGRVWIGTDNGVVVFAEEKFSVFHPGGGSEGPLVRDILPDREGVVVAADNGLWRFSGSAAPQRLDGPTGIAPDNYRALAETAEGLWLGTYSYGVWRLSGSTWQAAPAGSDGAKSVYQMSVEPSGTLYVSTNGNGLFFKPPGRDRMEHWGAENGLPSNVINAALEDREGNLWIGTYIDGLAKLSGKSVINHTEKQGLPDSCVFGISPGDTPDSLWLGTQSGAVHYQVRPVPKALEIIRASDGLKNEWVWKILRTSDGILWFLTDTSLQFRPKGEKILRELASDVPIRQAIPWDMTIDRQGNLWVCGEGSGGGLARRDAAGHWRIWDKTPAGKPLTSVSKVIPRSRGGVWIASKNTIFSCDGEALDVPDRPDLPSPISTLSAFYEDKRRRLWAGSDAGLAVKDADGSWRLLNGHPGFINHRVFCIGEDQRGIIWVNTARGSFLFRADGRVDSFTPNDGLAEWETNGNGFFCDSRGEIWIGTVGGMSQYDPAGQSANTRPPRLVVENVDLPKRSVEFPRSLDLGWGERSLIFNIAVLSFRNRKRAAFRAQLEGLEDDWLPPQSSGELRYTNLPAGDLRLLLRPVNESGVWGETVALPIHVRPPFWMTLWFQLTLGLSILAAVLGVFRWRIMILRRRNRELEREVSKRTAELEYLATYDPLTGLFNRRAVLGRLEREIKPERGGNRQFGLVMIDLNLFKTVNDTLGHAAGDRVLKEMAAKIQGCLRQGDDLGRLGGDEFLAILPGADLEALKAVDQRISEQECPIGEGSSAVVVTASVGGVSIPDGSSASLAALLAKADDLLYQVKRSGRRGSAVDTFQP